MMRTKSFTILLLAAFMMLATGCGSGSSTRDTAQSEEQSVPAVVDSVDEEPEESVAPEEYSNEESTADENVDLTPTRRSRSEEIKLVKSVSQRITEAADEYLRALGGDRAGDYNWSFKVVKSDEINAYCLPDGQVVVYTGIMPQCANADQLAVVVGHEVAHVVSKHSAKYVSRETAAQVGALAVGLLASGSSQTTQDVVNTVYNMGVNYGLLLPFSRKQEREADDTGLILMTIAGYDPDEAIPFWKKMQASPKVHIPGFLSDHPSDSKRISNLERILPEVKEKYSNGVPDKIEPLKSAGNHNETYLKTKSEVKDKYHKYKDKLKNKLHRFMSDN